MRGTTTSPRAAAAVGVLAALTAAVLPAAATTRAVRVGSYYFEDARTGDSQVVVQQGDRITFTFEGKAQHTATVDGMFSSGRKSPGQRYTTPLLSRVGTFTLYCQVHGAPRHGTALVVRRRPSPPASPTRARASAVPTKTAAPLPSSTEPSPPPSTSPTPHPSPSPTAAPVVRGTSPVGSPSTSPAAAAADAPDLLPAGPVDDSQPSWQLPALLLALFVAGAGAIAFGRRRRHR